MVLPRTIYRTGRSLLFLEDFGLVFLGFSAKNLTKRLPREKMYTITKCFQERFMGFDCETGVFTKNQTRNQRKGTRRYRAIAMTSVMSKWYVTCIILRMKEEKEPESWKRLHVGGVDGVSCQLEREGEPEGWKQLHVGVIDGTCCQHPQALTAQLLQKHWDRRKNVWHGSEYDPPCTSPTRTSRRPSTWQGQHIV